MKVSNNNLVSVIVPAYNAETVISDCVSSVVNQTYQNWEMVIVDDCSKDKTVEIIENYAIAESRIKLLKLGENKGVANARREAIKFSSGRYLAFLDADDMWKNCKLEEQLEFMSKNKIGFSMTSYEIMSEGKTNGKIFRVPEKLTYTDYLKNTIIGNLTVMIDLTFIPEFRIEDGPLEDVMTWMELLKNGNFAYGLDKNLATYRVTSNSVSGDKIKNAKRYFHLLKKRQELGNFKSVFYFVMYSFNALKKRYF
ncbi:glycosyltransferase family 2 protein [Aerococcus urinaeequi]|uniref:glycosyltransferase family 2 protein n=1 Tax=Aerococcus urinaeequi TaxID=51665 RepID=UPI003ED90EA9